MTPSNAERAASIWDAVTRTYVSQHGDTNFGKWLDSPVPVGSAPPRWDGISGVVHEIEEYLDWTGTLDRRVVVEILDDSVCFTVGTTRFRVRAKVRGGEIIRGAGPVCDVKGLETTRAVVLDLLGEQLAGSTWRRRVRQLARAATVSRVQRSYRGLRNLPWTFPSRPGVDGRWMQAPSYRLARRFARADAVGSVALQAELEAN
jgi:hypothetical protein